MTTKMRRIVIRSSLVVLWGIALAALFILNRGHTVFVDNKSAPDGGAYEAVELMKVSIDGGKGVEFFEGDRDRFPVTGSNHRIRIEFTDGRPPLEREFRVPIGIDQFLLSVPKMIAGIEPFIEPFVVEVATSRTDDEAPPGASEAASFGGAPAPDGAPVPGVEALAP